MSKKFAIVLLVAVALIASASVFAYQAVERNAPAVPSAKDKTEDKVVPHAAGNIYFGNPRVDLRATLNEGFEGGAIPADWTVHNVDGGDQWEAYDASGQTPPYPGPHSGSWVARCYYDTANDDWLVTPKLSVVAGDTLKFWASAYSSYYNEDFQVWASTTGNAVVDFTDSLYEALQIPQGWAEHKVPLDTYAGSDIYLAFRCISVYEFALYIDDITGPEIWVPAGPAIAFNTTDLSFGTVAMGSKGSKDLPLIIYSVGADPLTVSNVVSDNAHFTHDFPGSTVLSPGDSLVVTVTFTPTAEPEETGTLTVTHDGIKADSYITMSGSGIDALYYEDFASGLMPPTGWASYELGDPAGWQLGTPGYDDTYCAFHNDDNVTTGCDDWLVTPAITLPASKAVYELEFMQYEYYLSYYVYHGIMVSTGSGDPNDGEFVELMEVVPTVASVWEPIEDISLAAYAGQTIYLAFRYQGDYADEWSVDNVVIQEFIYVNQPPEIVHDPKGDTYDTTPTFTAFVTDAVEGVNSVSIFHRPAGVKDWTEEPMTLTGVLPDEYSATFLSYGAMEYYIQAVDDSGLVSYDPPGAPVRFFSFYAFEVQPLVGDQIAYDDGTVENATCWIAGYEDNRFAVRFTPPAYPCTLTSVELGIFTDWPDERHQPFALEVYDDDGTAGAPGTLLYGPDTTGSIGNVIGGLPPSGSAPYTLEWAFVCIHPLVIITEGDFYVAKAQVTSNPECEGLDIDQDGTPYSRSWMYDYTTDTWSEYYPGERNLMIRAYTSQVTTIGHMAGTVTEATKGPIEGAIVTAVGAIDTKSDTTDASGNYFIENLTSGLYDVTASAAGYNSQTQFDVVVPELDTVVVDFALTVDTALLRESFCGTFPPAGWTRYMLGTSTINWIQSTSGHDDACAAYHYYDASNYCDDWLVTPQMTIPTKGAYALSFWEYWTFVSWYDYHGIWISTGSGDPNDGQFVELTEVNTGAGYAWEQMGPYGLGAYAGQSIYLAFVYQGLDADAWLIDDVVVDIVQTGNIGGNVAEATKGPIEGAIVTANGNSDTTDASGNYLIENLSVGQYDVSATAAGYFPQMVTDVSVAADDTTIVDFALSAVGVNDILVVDADGSPAYYPDSIFTDVQAYFTDALDFCGYSYDVWEKMSFPEDGPGHAIMELYDAVVWFTGEAWTGSQTLTANDEIELGLYLDGGGKLFLSAQDYFYDRYPSAGAFSPGQFPYDYLGVTSVSQDLCNVILPEVGHSDGYAGSVAEGLSYDLFDVYTVAKVAGHSKNKGVDDGLYIDELITVGTAVFDADDGGTEVVNVGAVQYESTKGFKTVFTTVDFAGLVEGTNTRAELMCSIMDWLLAPPAEMWLSDGGVNPIIGDLSTTFTYSVTYNQLNDVAPTLKKVYIDDVPYDMTDPTGGSGPYSGGVVFTYQHQFDLGGNHEFYFDFSDGTLSDRLPSAGAFWGPMNGYYFWHFEDAAHFTPTGPTDDWQWGTPTDPDGPASAHSGEYCWGTNLAGDYSANSQSRLETPPLDFTSGGGTKLELKFWHWYDTEGYFDGGNVKLILPDTTILLFPDTTQAGIEYYPEDAHSTGNAWIPGEPGYSGHVQGFWEEAIFDLTPWTNQSNVVIAWDFGSDGSVIYPGWFIDDVVIWGEPPLPVELAGFTAIAGDRVVTLSWETRSELNNLGFQVYRRVEDGEFQRIDAEMIPGAGSSEDVHSYTYVDRGLTNGMIYYYQIAAVDFGGNVKMHDVVVSATPMAVLPTTFALSQNYPNPFNPNTEIKYQLPRDSRVVLSIYNVMGQEVVTLVDADLKAGYYTATWNARDARGSEVSAGIYFCRLQAGEFSKTRKMVLIK